MIGITLKNIEIITRNVKNPYWKPSLKIPDASIGIPSIAVFASNDMKNWYNYLEVDDICEINPFISSWKQTNFSVGGKVGEACLGNVYNTYLVTCLNTYGIATWLPRGESIVGPPFNDRCFQVAGICGVPCINTNSKRKKQELLYCKGGQIPVEYLATNGTGEIVLTFYSRTINDIITLIEWDYDVI